MRAIGYGRVSTTEQTTGAGLEAQRRAIEDEVERRGWQLAGFFTDSASGKSLKRRPGLERALHLIERGEADALMVAKLDRLSRSVMDFAALMERSQRKAWALIALDLGVDSTTPAGEAMANVMATFAQLERRMIGQRTREGLAVKKSQGVRLGRPPSLPSDVRRRVRRLHRSGHSLNAIAKKLNSDGVPTAHGGKAWHASTVRAIL